MRRGKFVFAAVCLTLTLTTAAQAQVTLLGDYRLGENDAGAVVSGAGNATTTDIAGAAENLTKAGTPTYAAAAVAGIGSSLSMNFNVAGDSYSFGSALPVGTNNFVIQGWVTRDTGTNLLPINNGNGGTSGAGILFHDNGHGGQQTWQGLYGGIAFLDTLVPVLSGVPTHLAVVRNAGTTTVYVNGSPEFVSGAGPNAPAGTLTVGGFDGRVDNVSLGTIAGTFTPATDLNFPFFTSANLTQLYTNGFEAADAGKFSSVGNGGVAAAAAYGMTTTEGTQLFAYNGGGQTPNAVVTTSVINGTAGLATNVYFDYGNFGANEPQRLLFEVLNAADNSVMYSQTIDDALGSNNVSLYSPFFFQFIPTVGNFRLRFTDVLAGSVGSSDGMLDNIRVAQVQAVPEPLSAGVWAIGALVVAGVMLYRRRR